MGYTAKLQYWQSIRLTDTNNSHVSGNNRNGTDKLMNIHSIKLNDSELNLSSA
ncbi:Putative uncharacterized protein [Moritella viscosa]|uniref:Uncharacterized protein n=1 Tax=Moritella viscosa TaxID=80854 RepID=A0A1K9YXF4_9GAMM|nr:Putative uncharacterized protein [Moritella viscosa]SGY87755.1 Putative uncharacterized protein [Moritella viscosa]SGY87775.1 Putative uncharacterized protein [Moritella viscosa]SGY89553.1 Putative uncharacterized protein [Moritella viscosa]SGY90086.1 Putative uncharacterized protein [Moritella viscosa]